ncbi:unnamed protein product [Enterobius vermicularis]|uniref:Transmembrane protein n=1 Tax=Enterobius vermicularis TaxID=51028 RepID=A0A0N4V938_ENTVE|nr:unnamed protein product [Enterobius vermicularis]
MKQKSSSSEKPIYAISISSETASYDDDDELSSEPTCCCGFMRITLGLRLVALLRLVLDLIALYCVWDTVFAYFLVISSIGTFTVLCIIISGLQQEEHTRLKYTKLWVAFKLVITVALILTVAIGVYEGDFDFLETVPLASETVILVITVSFVLMSSAFVQ